MGDLEKRIDDELSECIHKWHGELLETRQWNLTHRMAFVTRKFLENIAGMVASGIQVARLQREGGETQRSAWIRIHRGDGWTVEEAALVRGRGQEILERLWATVEKDLEEIQRIEKEEG